MVLADAGHLRHISGMPLLREVSSIHYAACILNTSKGDECERDALDGQG